MRELKGRVAVVTGGANGIGKGLATRFLEESMKVVVADNDAGDLEKAVTELFALGEVLGVFTDIADAASVQSLADAAVDRLRAVHLLCNNAGVGGAQRFSTINHATWDWMLGVDLWGVIHGCRIFRPILAAQDEAYIVDTASMSGFLTGGYLTPYNVAKAGVVSLSEGLAFRMGHRAPAYRRRGALPGLHRHGLPIFPHPEWLKLWADRVERVTAQAGPPASDTRPRNLPGDHTTTGERTHPLPISRSHIARR
jgi:NAD(P)-dependent dehydrogenase (short-subunit alcohol dehydrogenase family)